jgi:hypothetical protein
VAIEAFPCEECLSYGHTVLVAEGECCPECGNRMILEPDPDEEDEPIPYSEMTDFDRRDIEDRWIPQTR